MVLISPPAPAASWAGANAPSDLDGYGCRVTEGADDVAGAIPDDSAHVSWKRIAGGRDPRTTRAALGGPDDIAKARVVADGAPIVRGGVGDGTRRRSIRPATRASWCNGLFRKHASWSSTGTGERIASGAPSLFPVASTRSPISTPQSAWVQGGKPIVSWLAKIGPNQKKAFVYAQRRR